ncbi:DUF1800 domain-containing protein [Tabrizicola sp. J26]|uniref:DUF1800 domain-containing protein n=1 Tax=Alitabrizicola rongguiensis TaxID=2909234 RepID=UPI001F1AFAE0|nr:DUF1800 domain-containing protein [Tabrizicola rongguiensis]MCF1708448.1 DUF1800 domain-containing protein [Tabrizicola rongguiensis]
MEASLLEQIRFGYGPRTGTEPAAGGVDPSRVLAQLDAADPASIMTDRPSLDQRLAMVAEAQREAKQFKAGQIAELTVLPRLKQATRDDATAWILTPVASEAGFRERLVNFWANRLTVGLRRLGSLPYLSGGYPDDVARPYLNGRFSDMLRASAWHPAMLLYLDQAKSVGPDSRIGRKKDSGLNENYARELLELHTMGSGYSQADVTETARLLTGMSVGPAGSTFEPARAEPGRKTILGQTYGEGPEEIDRFLNDIALRPETAQSVSLALARSFLADQPSEATVARMAAAYLESGSELRSVYAAMLADPAATSNELVKIRSPQEFVAATLRAVDWPVEGLDGKVRLPGKVNQALAAMGQPPFRPRGPDGWPDTAAGWVSAPMLAARIDWAETVAQAVSRATKDRAEPVPLARSALGDLGNPDTIRAAGQAEQRWEGIAVLLGSPDFMRR